MSDLDPVIEKTAKVVSQKDKPEFQILGPECGHHCGARSALGSSYLSVGHCEKCHASPDKNVCEFDNPRK
jgi:hypothetical protein